MITKKEQVCYESDSSGLKGSLEKVVFPKSNEDVQKIINSGGFDIVPRGAGSGLEGGCVPNNSIVVDLSKMNKTLSFDLEKMFIYVEAGITIRELNEKLSF